MKSCLSAGIVLTAFLLLSSLPTVSADHAYSHRFVIEGRVIGNDGWPAAGHEVTFSSTGQRFEEPCSDGPHRNVTDARGDFRFCFHVHELDANTRVRVTVANVTVDKPMDTAYRRTVVIVEIDEPGTPEPEWNVTYRVAGKVWRPGPTTIEGVPVFGTAVAHTPVNMTLALSDGSTETAELVTDDYGDFDATFLLTEETDPADVLIILESNGLVMRRNVDPLSHRTTVGFQLPRDASDSQSGMIATFPDSFGAKAPGTSPPGIPIAMIAGIVIAVTLTLIIAKRRREGRE